MLMISILIFAQIVRVNLFPGRKDLPGKADRNGAVGRDGGLGRPGWDRDGMGEPRQRPRNLRLSPSVSGGQSFRRGQETFLDDGLPGKSFKPKSHAWNRGTSTHEFLREKNSGRGVGAFLIQF